MKKRVLCWLLALVMIVSLLPTFALSAAAADPVDYGANGVITNPAPATDKSGNLHLTKALAPGANGTYDITMESWATGEVKTQGITEKIPTDFVLVVDQSGSMDTNDNYYRVYGVKDYLFRYYPANYWFTGDIVEHLGTDIGWFMGETDATHNIDNAFYFREVVGDQTYYIPIKTTIEGKIGTYYMRFSYPSKKTGGTYEFNREVTTYSSNGNSPWYKNVLNGDVMTGGATWSAANAAVQTLYPNDNAYTYSTINLLLARPRTGMYINYPMYGRHLSYTKLCYRDVNGVEHEVASNSNGRTTWEYCDDNGIARTTNSVTSARPTYSGLYTFPGTTDRITALKAALNEFAGAVANETDDFGAVDNRVSIVGFSSPNYSNTELLTHTERDISSGSTNGWQKDTCDGNASEYYGKGLVGSTDGNVGTVNPKIENAIKAITADGGTQPEDGLNMAYQILTNRGTGEGKDTYKIRSGANKDQFVDRNTIVIFFTDGQPGDYHYSDQYSEANEVVAQAKQIKDYGKTLDYGTSIFSIGVFGESDANPLTYTHETRTNSQGVDKAWKYLGGWMESYHDEYYPYSWYCLRRQWRPNSASASDNYTATPNDTIFDYMSVVSSNYPDAEQFIAPSWLSGNYTGANGYTGATDGVRHKETAQTTNKYYRMASNQDTLVAAFLQAVTMNNEEITSDTSVPLNETAVFKDKVNLADFDTTGATYTVKWQPVKEQGGQIVNNGNAETKVNGAAVPADGQINYSGFNYSANFVTSAHPGQKLVITINGLTPKKTVGELKSNDGNAGVYGPEDEDPTVSITSPTLQFPESAAKTYLIDFNAKMTVATETTKLVGATNDTVTGTNGSFVKSGTNVTYQLSSGNQADKAAEINKAYTGVDTATVYGKLVNVENAKVGWNQITTVPASSVYYDDDLAKNSTPAVTVGDGSGKITGISADTAKTTTDASGAYYFTFYGTGIDVYCTTHSGGGYVSAGLFKCDYSKTNQLTNRVTDEQNKPVTVRNLSDGNYYNTPTISFTGLTADTYTVKISANEGAQYKLDGVRVYNPVKATEDGAATAAATELAKTPEANATYLNLRKVLLNDSGVGGFTVENNLPTGDVDPSAVSGVLFIDNVSSVVTMSHYRKEYNETTKTWETVMEDGKPKWFEEEAPIYQTQFDVYKANGPKNEIYLDGQQGITFQLSDKVPVGTKVWIGLSAPKTGSGSVTITGKDGNVSVNSVMDMYYDFTVPASRQIMITNQAAQGSGNIISVTNLKITGIADLIPAATPNNQDEVLHASRALFAPVTLKSVRMAANNGVDPEDVVVEPETPDTPDVPDTPDTPDQPDDPKPGWNDGTNDLTSILKNLFQMLLQSLSGLFSGLGNW